MKIPIKKYQKNAFIYLSGNVLLKEFYIIKSGQIKITKTNPILGNYDDIRGVGYIFGIIQCITGIPEEETAMATVDSEVFVIKKERIGEIFENHKKVVLKILSEYSEILRKLDADLTNYNFFPSMINRKEKIFDVIKKYINQKQEKKARHLLNVVSNEFPDDNNIRNRAKELFQDFKFEKIEKNPNFMYEIKLPPGKVVFTEFELGNNFYIIKKGKVRITKLRLDKEILLAFLADGDIFGEMAILNDKPRNAAVETVEETELMVIDRKGIDRLPAPIFDKLLDFISKRIWLVQQQLICYKLPLPISKIYFLLTSKIKQALQTPEREFNNSFIFRFPLKELFQMADYDYSERKKDEIIEFLNDKNMEFFSDAIKIRKIGELFDKNSYFFARSLISYNAAMKEI
jgi:CRP-like cAMP-binding protein